MEKQLLNNFKNIFNKEGELYFSPGRVNLIGEHIDYNGGFVMPAAISLGTYGVVRKNDSSEVRLFSKGYSKKIKSFNLFNIKRTYDWTDYIKGVFYVLSKRGINILEGIDLYISSTLPNGAGLSSSSSLELLVIVILNDLFNLNFDRTTMAEIGKEVENDFIEVKTGIMDQFAIANGKKGYAMMLNTESLEYHYVPIDLKNYQLVIANTNKERGLADSKYNERFDECRKSLTILQNHYNVDNLCELKSSDFDNVKLILNDDILYKRVKHVITEQERTINSLEVLNANDLISFAKNLDNSHLSLKNDYEVTGVELDTLVELTKKHGALGSRMTGAGFGGCIIAIVKKDKITNLITNVTLEYENIIGYQPTFYNFEISDGTKKL